MKTRIIDLQTNYEEGIEAGMRCAERGEVFAMPTETVYGLAANARKPEAVRDIFALKGRPGDNPLIVHISNMNMAFELARMTKVAEQLAEAFWPGPLTLVLPKRNEVPYEVTAGLKTVAIRMPDQPATLEMIERTQIPLAAPSANKSGRPSPTTAQHVWQDFDGEIPLILDGGACQVGIESTVLLLEKEPIIVRPGIITPDMIASVIGAVAVDRAVLSPMEEGRQTPSPGMKYQHYSPKANVIMIEGDMARQTDAIIRQYDEYTTQGKKCLILASRQTDCFYGKRNYVILGDRDYPETLCQRLYDALRQADEQHFDEIIIEGITPQEAGMAFMNRAMRAAGFQVIQA